MRVSITGLLIVWCLVVRPAWCGVGLDVLSSAGTDRVAAMPGETVEIQVALEARTAADTVGGLVYRLAIPDPAAPSQWVLENRDYGGHGWHQNDGLWDLGIPQPGRDTFPLNICPELLSATPASDILFSSVRADLANLPAPGRHVVETLMLRIPPDTPAGNYSLTLSNPEAATMGGLQIDVGTGSPLVVSVGPVYQTLDLAPGWNLVSFKMDPLDSEPQSLFSMGGRNSLASAVWHWDAQAGRYRRAEALVAGCGYWVCADGEGMLLENIPGRPLAVSLVPMRKGWNLVGPVGDGTQCRIPAQAALIQRPFWHGGSPFAAYRAAEFLRDGDGYWIYADEDISIDLALE